MRTVYRKVPTRLIQLTLDQVQHQNGLMRVYDGATATPADAVAIWGAAPRFEEEKLAHPGLWYTVESRVDGLISVDKRLPPAQTPDALLIGTPDVAVGGMILETARGGPVPGTTVEGPEKAFFVIVAVKCPPPPAGVVNPRCLIDAYYGGKGTLYPGGHAASSAQGMNSGSFDWFGGLANNQTILPMTHGDAILRGEVTALAHGGSGYAELDVEWGWGTHHIAGIQAWQAWDTPVVPTSISAPPLDLPKDLTPALRSDFVNFQKVTP